MKWFACLAVTGCTATLDMGQLRVDPPALDLDVVLGEPPPQVALRVYEGIRDVTDTATFATPLGTFSGGMFTSDGHSGGAATIAVTAGEMTASVPISVTVHGIRFTGGLPADASTWLAPGNDQIVTEPLDPADGAVLPPNLGGLDVDFGAYDDDDVHEIALTAPYLDLHVYAPGVPGSRHIALTSDEWAAAASTAHGGTATLEVRSTHSGGGAPVHVMSSQLAIADLAMGTLVFSGVPIDAAGNGTALPQLYRYDPRMARVDSFLASATGGCIGCHISISADGTRIASAGSADASGALVGLIIDAKTPSLLAVGDPASPWSTSAFDPSGALVTSYQTDGRLFLRDGTTGAVTATLAIGETGAAPAISPDGKWLAYVVNDPTTMSFVGTTLRLRTWNAATAAVGPPITLVTDTGVMAPQFSPDGQWIVYSRTDAPTSATTQATMVVRADGSAPPTVLTMGETDGIPRWASPIAPARAGGRDPEPMAWIAFTSGRPIGTIGLAVHQKEMWLAAYYPARGVVGAPIHLPGQTFGISALHAPVFVP